MLEKGSGRRTCQFQQRISFHFTCSTTSEIGLKTSNLQLHCNEPEHCPSLVNYPRLPQHCTVISDTQHQRKLPQTAPTPHTVISDTQHQYKLVIRRKEPRYPTFWKLGKKKIIALLFILLRLYFTGICINKKNPLQTYVIYNTNQWTALEVFTYPKNSSNTSIHFCKSEKYSEQNNLRLHQGSWWCRPGSTVTSALKRALRSPCKTTILQRTLKTWFL